MDNRLKRDLVKFFKKMNKNNLSLFKEDKSKLKDIEKIEDDEALIQEGLKQCQFVLKHFTEKIEIKEKEKEKEIMLQKEKEEKERLERQKKEKEEKEKLEKRKKELEEKHRQEELKKKELEKIKLAQKEVQKEIKKEEKKEVKIEQKKEEQNKPKEEPKKENKELTGLEAIKEKTKQKEKIESLNDQKEKEKQKDKNQTKVQPTPLEKKISKKLKTIKRIPTLSELTDEQFGSTEKAVYDLGDGIKITVEWKYLRDKTYIPKEDEEDPEKSEKVDLLFTTNYIDPLILHWGVFRAFHESEWIHPEKECYPEFSKDFDKKAIQTEFTQDETEQWPSIRIMLKRGMGFENVIGGINFVIYDPEKNRLNLK